MTARERTFGPFILQRHPPEAPLYVELVNDDQMIISWTGPDQQRIAMVLQCNELSPDSRLNSPPQEMIDHD